MSVGSKIPIKRSYVTLAFGVRVNRKSWYLGLLTGALLGVLLGLLFIYAFRQYAESGRVALPDAPPVTYYTILGDREVTEPSLLSPRASAVAVVPSVAESLEAISPAEEVASVESLVIQSILEKYRIATGLSDVQSLILRGRYIEDGRDFSMKLMVKFPGLVSKTLEDSALKIVCSFDGDQATIEVEDASGETHKQALSDVLYQQAILLEGSVLSLTSDRLPDALVYKWAADQRYDGRNCWTIRRRVSSQESMIHLIDKETNLELVRFVYFMHEGERQQLSLHLSDYRQQGKGYLPFAYTLKLNGEVRGEAQIESIQLNSGLMPWMFSAKESGT